MRPLNRKWSTQLKMLTGLLFVILNIAIDANAQIQVYDSDHRRVEVAFNNTLTQKDLDQFQQTLLEYGIILRYDAVDFDKKGRLENIEFTVDCKDGFSGSAKTEGLKKDSRFGFFRDYAADAMVAKPPFGTGDLNEIAGSEK